MIDPSGRLHYHHLCKMARSPAHCLDAMQRDEGGDTLSTRMGSGFHARMAGKAVVIAPMPRSEKLTKKDGDPTEYGAWLLEQLPGALVLTAKEYDSAARMADAVLSDPIAAPLIAQCKFIEQRIEWETLGIKCAGTPDAFGSGLLLEFKSDRDARPERFQKTGQFRGYPGQVSWYQNGLFAACGYEPHNGIWTICVENSRPHPVVCHRMTASILDYGARLWRGWFERYRVCAESNEWPGYAQGPVEWEADEFGTDGEESA